MLYLYLSCFTSIRQHLYSYHTLSPVSFMYSIAVYCANTAKQHRSKLQSSKGERSNIHVGLAATTPHIGCRTHFGLPTDSEARPFYSEADPCPASLRERGLPSVSATWSTTILKECVILQARHAHVCPDKADAACRREVGMARLTALTVLCL